MHWDPETLAFHRSSRDPEFARIRAAAPAAAELPPDLIALPASSPTTAATLADVLDARRTWRTWSAGSIPFDTFSQFLWLTAREHPASHRGPGAASRPYPSGGATYSLEIYPVLGAGAVGSLRPGIYRYIASAHGLQLVAESEDVVRPFLAAAGRAAGVAGSAPSMFVITSRFAEIAATYRHVAYGLVLKEVGCLFQTFYLVAEALGLAPCALGGGTPAALFAKFSNTTELDEPIVGEFILGARG